ncbi:protein of unknown function [Xenorhabdus poinarii G6]|uniref:Uncharacterized protein n=1 Tax=Xenorhabdus poinarii G6 TaxID=1354304 RepID=A0A068R1J8_9GAMM|nr:protein of unknown function [Xenorhabdus poinarii G6]
MIAVANSVSELMATSYFPPSNEGGKTESGDKKGHTE